MFYLPIFLLLLLLLPLLIFLWMHEPTIKNSFKENLAVKGNEQVEVKLSNVRLSSQ